MHDRESEPDVRPTKRARLSDTAQSAGVNPLGIRPLGNLLLPGAKPNSRNNGLGSISKLPDDVITLVFSNLEAEDWLNAQAVSRAFLAWCSIEALWKVEYLRATDGRLRAWHGSWRDTYIIDVLERMPAHNVRADTVASDVLYQPMLCAIFDAEPLFEQVRGSNGSIRRVDARDYRSSADLPREPLILTHAIHEWPANEQWSSLQSMCQRVGNQALFRAEAALVTLPTYARYAEHAHDDSPLYLFHAAPLPQPLDHDFKQPAVFSEDFFAALGEKERPDHQWLIIGPTRAGSTFHQDPNGTSAWNAVVAGAKAWVCFDPSIVPPGIRVSQDWSEVETPLSVAEWLMAYLPAARAKYGVQSRDPLLRGKMLEGVCETGETFYIPSGWWHLVINLEPSIAITQNYCGIKELPAVLRFMRDRPDQISGLRNIDCDKLDSAARGLYDRFLSALEPELREIGLAGLQELDAKDQKHKTAAFESGQAGFSFDFSADDLADDVLL